MSGNQISLPLREALLQWCFPERVEDVQEFEVYFLSQELATFGWPNLGGASNRGQPVPLEHISREEAQTHLDNAWRALLLNFRQLLERRRIYLWGVQSRPTRGQEPVHIAGHWAADFNFDVLANTIEMGDQRFVSVRATDVLPPTSDAPVLVAATQAAPTPNPFTVGIDGRIVLATADVGLLSCEVIAALLEEHARRVVEEHGIKLLGSGVVSLAPLVRRKFEHRVANGETMDRVGHEAQWLSDWAREVAPSYHRISQSTVESAIRVRYAELKPRSNSQI
ncbi:hypothetical protein GXW78_03620 [Roseomonas terrae]|uniref:Uncharacterized protein n=1 Tax=Neoroseomonas terrae TaxID=424799 RepID=A0ABS5ECJ5_9PROT|nr:hypothetical protein [Neoroseomonas terrae]MBR0648735.1 hypothetical protein [Neoroseomonas terrae]